MVFVSWDSVPFGNNFLNIYQGIIFLSLPVSISYGITMLLLPMHIPNLVFSIGQFLLRHTELILTISRSSSVYSCDTSYSISLITLLFLLWQTFWKCHILLHSIHVLPYAGHCLGWCVSLQYLHGCHCALCCIGILTLLSFTFWTVLFCWIALIPLMYSILSLSPLCFYSLGPC